MEGPVDMRPLLVVIATLQDLAIDLLALLEAQIPEVRIQCATSVVTAIELCERQPPVMALLSSTQNGAHDANQLADLAAAFPSSQIVLLARATGFPAANFVERHPGVLVLTKPFPDLGAMRLLRAVLDLDPLETSNERDEHALTGLAAHDSQLRVEATEQLMRLREDLHEICLALETSSHDERKILAIADDPLDSLVGLGFALMPVLSKRYAATPGAEQSSR
jgi:hypothetical protein